MTTLQTGGASVYMPGSENQQTGTPADDPRWWWVDVGPFKDRLGMDAPAIYTSNHDACKGLVGMIEGRKYIDLKDPRIFNMLGILIANAQPSANAVWVGSGPMTSAKRDAIVNTPTTEFERHVKGLIAVEL